MDTKGETSMRRIIISFVLSLLAATVLLASPRRELTESYALQGAEEVAIELEVGELTIESEEIDRLEVTLKLRCRSGSASCERRLERIEIVSERGDDRLQVSFDGISKTTSSRMEIEVFVRVPRRAELVVDMGIGELDVTGVERDIFVDMGIGEVRLWLDESHVGSVFLDAGIGESALYGAEDRADVSRPFLIGSELDWEAGDGTSEVVVDLGIGEISVHLE